MLPEKTLEGRVAIITGGGTAADPGTSHARSIRK